MIADRSLMDYSDDDVAALKASGEFDEQWYIAEYADVSLSGIDPARHFLWLGRRLGRQGRDQGSRKCLIESSSYERDSLTDRPEVFETPGVLKPTFLQKIEKLADWPAFDREYLCYQLNIPEIRDPLEAARLFYEFLDKRNLLPNSLFDPDFYRYYNDLDFEIDPVYHYLTMGAHQRLRTHILFDVDFYLGNFQNDLDISDPLAHYWEFGYPNKLLPFDEEKIKIIPQIRNLFFTDTSMASENLFDPELYRQFNADLAALSNEALSDHFVNSGQEEGRIGSLEVLLKRVGLPGRSIPLDFDPDQYVSLHADLEKDFVNDPWMAFRHFVSTGMREGRRYTFNQYNVVRPIKFKGELKRQIDKSNLCVLVHLYYPEMWDELKNYIDNIKFDFDLYVNFVESTWNPHYVNEIRKDYPQARIKISPNEGRDIGGFFSLLKNVDFEKYLAFALLHSKKSPHVSRGYASMWKKGLLGAILGTSNIVQENIDAFLSDDQVGIIGSIQSRHRGVEKNSETMRRLFSIYNISSNNEDCEYVSGTMMMVRSDVMKAVYLPLADHKFMNGDGKGIEHHIDGQIEHSVERIFGNVMRQMGFRFLWR